jgi:hypothetical protein
MPNDDAEQERLDMTHHPAVLGTGRKLFHSPIDEEHTKQILDIGTGTGVWAIEVGWSLSRRSNPRQRPLGRFSGMGPSQRRVRD